MFCSFQVSIIIQLIVRRRNDEIFNVLNYQVGLFEFDRGELFINVLQKDLDAFH